MITRRDKVVVGIFVFASGALLATFLGVLWGINASKPYKRYRIVTDQSVSGLSPSSAVKYLGVDAGKVERMELDDSTPPKVCLTIAVMVNTPIKKDTKAQLTPVGITGLQTIELVRGTSSEELAPGSEIPYVPSKFTDIVTKVDRLSGAVDVFFGENKEKISQALDNANRLLTTTTASVESTQRTLDALASRVNGLLDENRQSIRDVLERSRATLDDVSKLARKLEDRNAADEVLGAVADARRAINDLDATVRELRTQLGPTGVSDAVADVRSTARAAADAATAARELVQRVGGRVEDDLDATGRVLDQLTRTARGLEDLSREVKERPSLLLRDLERRRREVVDK